MRLPHRSTARIATGVTSTNTTPTKIVYRLAWPSSLPVSSALEALRLEMMAKILGA